MHFPPFVTTRARFISLLWQPRGQVHLYEKAKDRTKHDGCAPPPLVLFGQDSLAPGNLVNMAAKTHSTGLLALALVLVGLALWTLLPFSASKPNDLGYVSTCPFAPWSTASLLIVAAVIWAIRKYLLTRAE